jgi:alpha-tubulin suppressor-like RCC1 family protein
VKEFKNNVQ